MLMSNIWRRRVVTTPPFPKIDVERLQVDDINNWLQAWVFMEACGFVTGEAADNAICERES